MHYGTEELIEEVIRIAELAGKVIMEVYQTADFGVESKSDESPLTRADRSSNELICRMLSALTPDCPLISEENEMPLYEERKRYRQYWLIDPLDGTKEFIKKNGEFAVNIAFMEGDEPVLGVVHLPAKKETYWACLGKGAWKIANGQSVKLSAASFSISQMGLVIAVSLSHSNDDTTDYLRQFQQPVILARGSALKMMMIAEGSVHLHPRFGGTMEWDTAAPQIIVEEAGGKVLQMDGCSLRYNKECLRNPDYVVYGKLRE